MTRVKYGTRLQGYNKAANYYYWEILCLGNIDTVIIVVSITRQLFHTMSIFMARP